MGVVYQPGQELTDTDLRIFLKDRNGDGIDVLEIRYSLYWWGGSEWETVSGSYQQTPESGPGVGQYWVEWDIPAGQNVGQYQIRWDFRNAADAPFQQTRTEFSIVKITLGTSRTAVVSDLAGTPYVVVH